MAYSSIDLLAVYLDARNQRRKVGRLALKDRRILFEYDALSIASDIEISPIKLALRSGISCFFAFRIPRLESLHIGDTTREFVPMMRRLSPEAPIMRV
jgi:hypothetical protein